jgi:hypothetical protein
MRGRWAGLLVFGALAIAKLLTLIFLGPLRAPDTPAYVEFAKTIVSDPDWRSTVDFASSFAPNTIYRMIGYPMLIVVFQALVGERWDYAIVAAQLVLAAYATSRVFLVLDRISGNRGLAAGLAVAQATAVNFVFDQFVLTDSFYLSLLILATCGIVETSLDSQARIPRLAGIALCFVGCFLLREATSTLVLLWLPLLVLALSRAMKLRSALAVAVLIVAPVFVAKSAYSSWNYARTGERLVTTSYQLVLLQPLVKGYRYDKSIFAGDTPFDAIARRTVVTFSYDEVWMINHLAHKELGWTAPVIAKEVERRFWRFAWNHPRAALMAVREEVRFNHAMLLVSPVPTMNLLLGWIGVGGKNPVSLSTLNRRVFKEGRVTYLPLLVVDLVSRLASIIILLISIWGVYQLVFRFREMARRQLVPESLAMAALVAGFYGAHAIVHLEDRYLMALFPIVLMIFANVVRLYPGIATSVMSRLPGHAAVQ